MNTSDILSLLASSKEVKRLYDCVSASDVLNVRVGGLIGSSAPLVFASLLKCHDDGGGVPTMIFVMSDVDEAGYFYHDLVQMLGDRDVLFFPSSYKRAIKYNQKDAGNGILRTEVLSRVTTDRLYIVTYPEALVEKVVSKESLDENTIVLCKGGCYDVNVLEKRLLSMGFARRDYVYEPGQFAVRGSIVDVYSYSCENPYRVDFFGDEVDSIRTFDVQSQLSVDKVDRISVVPQSADLSKYVSVLSFFPDDAVMVSRDFGFVCDVARKAYDNGFSRQAVLENDNSSDDEACLDKDKIMVNGDEFRSGLSRFRAIELRNGMGDAGQDDEHDSPLVQFRMSPQPMFHKNFDMLRDELMRLTTEGYKVCVFADSEKQTERLMDILSDAEQRDGRSVSFEPVNKAIHEGFADNINKRCYFTDHQIFDRFHKYNLKSDKAHKGKIALTLKDIQQFNIGDYVVHIDHGIGRFGGLVRVNENGVMQEKIRINYSDGGFIFVSIHALHKVSKYKAKDGEPPRVSKLGSGAWERLKDRVKTKVKDIARDLIRLYAERRKEKGFSFSPDSYLQRELEASFLYEDTPDQLKATMDVKADMEKPLPMDRLVCGDVGFGKTEVAVRAAFKAACDNKQVAVLVPTTVLAYQHYKTFCKRLDKFPVRIEYFTRARSAKEIKEIRKDLAEGKVDIVIGTHKLVGKDVKFKDLGLLIIDEEQKFGVAVKEKLRQTKVNIDTLTLTATPIPRTLQFSLMGARDLSSIQTPPPNRHPIQTEIHTFSAEIIAEAINFEMSRNGQVFIVNNRINGLSTIEEIIHKYVPDARVCVGHGQMNPQELEKIVFDFMNYDYDVMLSTTIVENGIDVPNANTIIINSAQNYGLSDLHQMRGRVGRGNRKAFCYLLAPPLASLSPDSRRRLQAIENFSDLGSGIHIAMQDLDIRGAGNMLGAEQSGFIADLGYETYQKVLSEAVAELRKSEFPDLNGETGNGETDGERWEYFVEETVIDTDIPAFLPEEYVPSSGERMSLYRELDSMTDAKQIEGFRVRLKDRFGDIPDEGEELMRIMPVKWYSRKLGIEKVTLRNGRMTLYMVSYFDSPYYQSDAFSKIIDYAMRHLKETKLREGDRRSLIVDKVSSIRDAVNVLSEITGEEQKK